MLQILTVLHCMFPTSTSTPNKKYVWNQIFIYVILEDDAQNRRHHAQIWWRMTWLGFEHHLRNF